MNRHVQTTGVRLWAGDDLLELQSETLRILDGFFSQFGNLIICGCELKNGTLSAGLVGLWGYDPDGQRVYKVAPLPEIKNAPTKNYIYLKCTVDLREYGDGQNKPVKHVYTAEHSNTIPQTDYVYITASTSKRFTDAIQDSAHRFVTDTLLNKLNSIAPNANNYAHPTYQARNLGLYRVQVDAEGHVTGASLADKSHLGLGSVDNTPDNQKQVFYAQTAGKANTVQTVTADNIYGALGYTPASAADCINKITGGEVNGFIYNAAITKALIGQYMNSLNYYGMIPRSATNILFTLLNQNGTQKETPNTFVVSFFGKIRLENGVIGNYDASNLRSVFTALLYSNNYYGIAPVSSAEVHYGKVTDFGYKTTTPTTFKHSFIGVISADKIISRTTAPSTTKKILCDDGGYLEVATAGTGTTLNYTNKIAYIQESGGMDIGNSLDFHFLDNSLNYDIRLAPLNTYSLAVRFNNKSTFIVTRNDGFMCLNEGNSLLARLNFQNDQIYMDATGNLKVTGTVNASNVSDSRLKKQIKTVKSGLELVAKLRPVTFQWNKKAVELDELKAGEKNNFGFIADEVENILPDAVSNGVYGKYKGIDYIQLIPVLTAAIQEQQKIIEDLKKRVETLEEK